MTLKCVNGDGDFGAHDFQTPMSAGTDMEPLLYCRKCGEVRRLEMETLPDGPIQQPDRNEGNAATPGDLRQIVQDAAAYRRLRGWDS